MPQATATPQTHAAVSVLGTPIHDRDDAAALLPTLRDDPTIPYLSPSTVKKVLACGAYWLYNRLTPKEDPMGIDGIVGLAVHDALELVAMSFREVGLWPGSAFVEKAVQTAMREQVQKHLDSDSLRKGDDAPDVLQAAMVKATGLAMAGQVWLSENVEAVLATETCLIDKDRPGYAVLGYEDLYAVLRDGNRISLDYKTASRAPKAGLLGKDHAFQVLEYAGIRQKQGDRVDLTGTLTLAWSKTGGAKAVLNASPVVPPAVAWAQRLTQYAWERIVKHDLDPNPIAAGWLCAAKFCPHYAECPGAYLGNPSTEDGPDGE